MSKRNRYVGLVVVVLLFALGIGAFWLVPGEPVPLPKKDERKGPPIGDEIPFDAGQRMNRTAFNGGKENNGEKSLHEQLAGRSQGGPLSNMPKEDWRALSALFPEQMQTVAGCVALATRDLKACEKAESPRPFCKDVVIISSYLFAKDDLNGLKKTWPEALHADFERFFRKDKTACQGLKARGPLYLMCMLNARAPEEVNDPDSAEFTSPFTNASPELENLRDGRILSKLPVDYRSKLELLKKAVLGNEAICKEIF